MVKALNVKDKVIKHKELSYISKDVSDSLPRSQLHEGDIVMTYVGINIGEVAIVDGDYKYHLAPNVAKIQIYDKTKYLPEFFVNMFACFIDYIKGFSTATSQPKIGMGEIRKIPFIVPSIEEQEEFVNLVKKVDKSKEELENGIVNLKGLYDKILDEQLNKKEV